MSSSLRRGTLAATALVLSIAPLSACAAGTNAQTLEVKPDNAATSVGDIKLQNVNVITQPEATATGPAVITGKVFNNGDTAQELKSVKLIGKNTTVKLTPAKGSGPLVVPARGSVILGGKGNASAVLPSGREGLKDGEQLQLAFTFGSTGDVRIGAFVVPAKSYFKEWGPSEGATATQSGKPGAPGTKPSGSASAKPSGAAGGKEGKHGKASPEPGESAHAGH